jgi:hypothetical protein
VPADGYDPEAVLRHFEGKLARFKQPHHVVTVTARCAHRAREGGPAGAQPLALS